VSPVQKRPRGGTSDVAGSAGDQNLHGRVLGTLGNEIHIRIPRFIRLSAANVDAGCRDGPGVCLPVRVFDTFPLPAGGVGVALWVWILGLALVRATPDPRTEI
jgi:hypothetical protein